MPKTTEIKWEIPYETLIRKNGLGTCLEIVPGTREYITHTRKYGKAAQNGKNKTL